MNVQTSHASTLIGASAALNYTDDIFLSIKQDINFIIGPSVASVVE